VPSSWRNVAILSFQNEVGLRKIRLTVTRSNGIQSSLLIGLSLFELDKPETELEILAE